MEEKTVLFADLQQSRLPPFMRKDRASCHAPSRHAAGIQTYERKNKDMYRAENEKCQTVNTILLTSPVVGLSPTYAVAIDSMIISSV
jgi:hypothetical protein